MSQASGSAGLRSTSYPKNPALRILLIDDNADDRARIIQELRPGFSEVLPAFSEILIDEVSDDKRLQYLLETDQFDVVLMEANFAWTDGLSVLRAVKSRYPHCPVIMVTAQRSEALAVEALKAGLDDYLSKEPQDLVRLPAALWSALEKSQTRLAEAGAFARLKSLFEDLPVGIYRAGPNGELFDTNPTLTEMLGYSPTQSLVGLRFADLYLEPDAYRRWQQVLLERSGVVRGFEARLRRKDGAPIWVRDSARAIRDAEGRLLYYEGVLEDITGQKEAEQEVINQALHDPLTSLPNRASFTQLLDHLLEPGTGQQSLFAVLYLDLDRFQLVNETLGHQAGDELLVAVTGRLKSCLRPEDTVARLGEDEFAVLLGGLKSLGHAGGVAQRIQQELTLPFQLGEQEVFTSASIGIALSTKGYEEGEDVLRDAEIAMYRAKASGKAGHQVFESTMRLRQAGLLRLETELRRGVERGEFRAQYQPIISLASGQIVGFEALLRWQHPVRGLLSPADFLAAAEESGAIVPMGWWILREACRQMQIWQRQFHPNGAWSINVNLAYKQFVQPQLVEQVDAILKETGLDAVSLNLELVENVIMEHVLRESAESAMAKLLALKALGVRLVIDDFGTGYSSLSYLHRFPAHVLKVDRSFVSRMAANRESLELVRLIIMVAHALGMQVVAEGVETAEQRDQLQKLGCDFAQGFLFAKSLDPAAAEALMASWKPKQ